MAPGVQQIYKSTYFHEFVIRLPRSAREVLHELAKKGIQAGYLLSNDYVGLDNCILVCVTETKTIQDLNNFAQQLAAILA